MTTDDLGDAAARPGLSPCGPRPQGLAPDGASIPIAGMRKSGEQQARDMLERMGIEDAQSFTAGDVCELANFIADRHRRIEEVGAPLTDEQIDAIGPGDICVWSYEDARYFARQVERLHGIGVKEPR